MVVDRYLWTGLHGYNSLQKHPPRLGWLHLNRKYKNSLQNHQKHMVSHLSIEFFAFFSPLSLSHVSFVSHLPDGITMYHITTYMLLSILLPFNLFTETQPKKNPVRRSSKPQATANLCTLPSPPLKRLPSETSEFSSHPFVSRSSKNRQEYDVRHSILVPGSDALRPKLATKAALKCLQRAEGGGWKKEIRCGANTCGFLMTIYSLYYWYWKPIRHRKSHTFFCSPFFGWSLVIFHQKGAFVFFQTKNVLKTQISADSPIFVAGFRRGQRWAKSELFCRRTWEDGRYETTCLTGQSQGLWIPGRTQVEGHWGGSLVSVVLTHSFCFSKDAAPVCLGCYKEIITRFHPDF